MPVNLYPSFTSASNNTSLPGVPSFKGELKVTASLFTNVTVPTLIFSSDEDSSEDDSLDETSELVSLDVISELDSLEMISDDSLEVVDEDTSSLERDSREEVSKLDEVNDSEVIGEPLEGLVDDEIEEVSPPVEQDVNPITLISETNDNNTLRFIYKCILCLF